MHASHESVALECVQVGACRHRGDPEGIAQLGDAHEPTLGEEVDRQRAAPGGVDDGSSRLGIVHLAIVIAHPLLCNTKAACF